MDNLTPKSLADSIYKKHESLVEKYSKELNSLDRIALLEEKLDQLKYWIKEHRYDTNIDRYIEEKNNTEKELENLKKSGGYDSASYNKRNSLDKKIKIHTSAMNYWKKVSVNNGTIS